MMEGSKRRCIKLMITRKALATDRTKTEITIHWTAGILKTLGSRVTAKRKRTAK